jgi:SAM-dependent methyltransferase
LIKSAEAAHAAVLDIGCGDGAALERYRNAGWATHGIEPNEAAAERARAMGHDVVSGGFPAAAPANVRFDVVRMRHVIEHLPDPLQALDRGFDLVSPGGRLYVELPNLGGALARVSGKHYWGLEPPRHLVIPHRDELLERLRASPVDEVVVSAYSRGDGIARTCMIWSQHDRRRHAHWYLGDEPTTVLRLVGRASEPLAMVADAVGQGDLLRIVARRTVTAPPRANGLVEPACVTS